MFSFDKGQTPDYSRFVVHFTKDKPILQEKLIDDESPLSAFKRSSAKDRLKGILRSRQIYATPVPFLPHNREAVCFTECIWDALRRQAVRYSAFGVVFSKRLIYDAGGGPALYMRGEILEAYSKEIPEAMEPFIQPFDPDAKIKPGIKLDWLHEREWRLPKSFQFEYSDVEYVLVGSISDADWIVHQIGATNLPETKVIPMEVYDRIKAAWRSD